MQRSSKPRRSQRTAALVAFDVIAWLSAAVGAVLMRIQAPVEIDWSATLLTGLACAVGYLAIGMGLRLHEGRARPASLDEMILIGGVAGTAGALVFAVNLFTISMPRSVPAIATLCFVVLACWGRAMQRRLSERAEEAQRGPGAEPVVLVGAGEGARALIRSMARDPEARWRPVAMVDDDPRKRHLRIRGVPVGGTTDDLAEVVTRLGARTVILAVPSAGKTLVADVRETARRIGVALKVVPEPTQLLTGRVGVRDLRDLDLTDLLGRNQVDTDVSSIASYLRGKRVLVTGAGGSIGAELCRQISRFAPGELIMLDRDESALHAVQLSLRGRALLDSEDVVLCDIRDFAAVHTIFAARRPQVVFHAAALKHLPMLEQYPAEAVKTNVAGTRNVLEAAVRVGAETLVNISTDKAADPTSVLGWSKRLAERLTATYAALHPVTRCVSVRFGNVIGSRGSVLTAFAGQIARGGPVTVTHPEVTRYFMTIEEACQLVVQAGAIGAAGEALVLEMGPPVRILDVARQLIELDGGRVDIEFTGLRPGEKMHEDLFGADEPRAVRPAHPLISHVSVPCLDPRVVDDLPRSGSAAEVISALSLASSAVSVSRVPEAG